MKVIRWDGWHVSTRGPAVIDYHSRDRIDAVLLHILLCQIIS